MVIINVKYICFTFHNIPSPEVANLRSMYIYLYSMSHEVIYKREGQVYSGSLQLSSYNLHKILHIETHIKNTC